MGAGGGAGTGGADGDALAFEGLDRLDAAVGEHDQVRGGAVEVGQGEDVGVLLRIVGQLPGGAEEEIAGIDHAEVGVAAIDPAQVFHRTGRGHVRDFDIGQLFRETAGDGIGEVLKGAAVGAAGKGEAGFGREGASGKGHQGGAGEAACEGKNTLHSAHAGFSFGEGLNVERHSKKHGQNLSKGDARFMNDDRRLKIVPQNQRFQEEDEI